jgi:hypothetical protein
MRAGSEKLSLARAIGNSGCDYLTTGTLTYATQWPNNTSKGWYGFVVLTAATVTAVTFKDLAGNILTLTPTWKSVEIPAGAWVPAGFIAGKDAYISAITLSGGVIMLYCD